ncbi:MAG: DUF6268 family outer membrane beta-barrel protein [Pirellulaceae bacterium]|nr:DUF6268 family outer membrane beta-barrel protein [Pirellulaceae bacterium]
MSFLFFLSLPSAVEGQNLHFIQQPGQGAITPIQGAPQTLPPSVFGQFDPYSTQPLQPGTPILGQPNFGQPFTQPTVQGGYPQGYGGVYPQTYGGVAPYPGQTPTSVYPNGIQTPVWNPNMQWGQPMPGPYMKLFQGVRLDYTFMSGSNSKRELDINDVQLEASLLIPNFMWTNTPILVNPGFGWHFWSGPGPTFAADLPSKGYDAYVDFGWRPQLTPRLRAEMGFRTGLFTDFQTVSSDSLRIQGTGVAAIQATPNVTIKTGIAYIDRARIKMLPVAGVVWKPTQSFELDAVFPRPKMSQYLTTVGNREAWWYLMGEYSGGSWSVERAGGLKDRFDYNDIRVALGIEWGPTNFKQHPTSRGMKGFFEVGYVFDRELIFVVRPQDNLKLRDTWMLSAGFSY